jgi:hypothetical protein
VEHARNGVLEILEYRIYVGSVWLALAGGQRNARIDELPYPFIEKSVFLD